MSTCRHCQREIVQEDGTWVDPQATGDDSVWRETCDSHDTFAADHEPSTLLAMIDALSQRSFDIIVTRSAGSDGAILIMIEGTFGEDGQAPLRILVNDDQVFAQTDFARTSPPRARPWPPSQDDRDAGARHFIIQPHQIAHQEGS